MRRKRAFEYTDTEKKQIVKDYYVSNLDIDSFSEQTGISSDVLEFWIESNKPKNKSIYLSIFHAAEVQVKGVYTEKDIFDKTHIPDENADEEVKAVMSAYFQNNILLPEYYDRIGVNDPDVNRYEVEHRIEALISETGLKVHMEQSVLSSEFLCKATMYLIDPDPKNFTDPLLSATYNPDLPIKQAYLRIKPCHEWSRPKCRQDYVKIICLDKNVFDTTGQIVVDTELQERLDKITDDYILKEEFTPRHYKNYRSSLEFWGEDMMDYFDVKITDYMLSYITTLLRTLNIEVITDNDALNEKFIIDQ